MPADELLFCDEDADTPAARLPSWRVLIADDENDVHESTVFALRGFEILGRPVSFLHAYSAAEARRLLTEHDDVAVVLLDVVMERVNAGLDLVRVIREELGRSDLRIVLRTGQPGYAPEMDVVRDYDINDYKAKADLTQARLYTTLTAAIRSYNQLHMISASRRGLDMIVNGSARLMAERGLAEFAAGVITQINALLGLPPAGLIVATHVSDVAGEPEQPTVVAAAGAFEGMAHLTLDALDDETARDMLRRCLDSHRNEFADGRIVLSLGRGSGTVMAVYVVGVGTLDEAARSLVEVFCSNVSTCLANLDLFGQLKSAAYADTLLRLPNRARLVQEIDRRRTRGEADDTFLLLLNLDHFSETNEALGHQYGDEILRAVSARLVAQFAAPVMVARVHGDTFALLGPADDLDVESVAALFRVPFEVEDGEQMITATFGGLMLREVEGGGSEAIKNASIALKRAKTTRRGGFARYDRRMGDIVRERVDLVRALRSALPREELFLCFQPQVRLDNGRIIGAEALLRWRRPNGELTPPDRFIPVAEHSGLIVDIGRRTLRAACQCQVAVEAAGFPGFRMAVNISLAQFRHPGFLGDLRDAISESGVRPAQLELEITESMAMLEPDYVNEVIRTIKRMGVTVAVDDFGTGFSSLSYLQRLEVDRLKIDRGFTAALTRGVADGSIVHTIIQLARNLDLTVIAEGVETVAQAKILTSMGCREGQGFLIARPMPREDLTQWLMARRETGWPVIA